MTADPLAGLTAYVRELVRAELAKHTCRPAPATDGGPVLLTMSKAAERASVGRSTLARWIAAGLPTVTLPGREAGREIRRVRTDDLDRWIDINGRRNGNHGAAVRATGDRAATGRAALRSGAVSTAGAPTSLHAAVMARAGLGQRQAPPAARRSRGKAGAGTASR